MNERHYELPFSLSPTEYALAKGQGKSPTPCMAMGRRRPVPSALPPALPARTATAHPAHPRRGPAPPATAGSVPVWGDGPPPLGPGFGSTRLGSSPVAVPVSWRRPSASLAGSSRSALHSGRAGRAGVAVKHARTAVRRPVQPGSTPRSASPRTVGVTVRGEVVARAPWQSTVRWRSARRHFR